MPNNTPQKSKRTKNILLIVALAIFIPFSLLVLIGIFASVSAENERQSAVAAEQARLAADPISINGIYNAHNTARSSVGAQPLANLQNLTTAAEQKCSDMITNNYFDYKNPSTGKDANSYISDNIGNLWYKNAVSTLFTAASNTQTSADAVSAAIANQATNLNNPDYNSVGWAICQSPNNPQEKYIVGMLANIQDKPVAPRETTRYVPTYTAPRTCYTNYNDYGGYASPTATTSCY